MLIRSLVMEGLKEGASKDNEFQSLTLFETNDSSVLSDYDEFIIDDDVHKRDVEIVEYRRH